jgi:hypothetical protein
MFRFQQIINKPSFIIYKNTLHHQGNVAAFSSTKQQNAGTLDEKYEELVKNYEELFKEVLVVKMKQAEIEKSIVMFKKYMLFKQGQINATNDALNKKLDALNRKADALNERNDFYLIGGVIFIAASLFMIYLLYSDIENRTRKFNQSVKGDLLELEAAVENFKPLFSGEFVNAEIKNNIDRVENKEKELEEEGKLTKKSEE